jgi:hypothetical protein
MDALAKMFTPTRFQRAGLKPDWLAVLMFIVGLASARMVSFVGEMYIGELLLPQLALVAMVANRNRDDGGVSTFGLFIQAAILMLAGYIASDIYRETNAGQFLRGWARVIVLSLDFIALVIVVRRDKRYLWWFILGLAIGALLQLKIRGVPVSDAAGWKFGYSTPLGYLLGALSCLLPVKLASIAFAGLGLWNIYMDFRIGGAICIIVSGALWFRSSGATGLNFMQSLRLVIAACIAGSLIVGALIATEELYKARRQQSNQGREAGIVVAMRAIVDSPLVGYGSWPTDPWLIGLYRSEAREGGLEERELQKVGSFTAHSQLLQAWVEGGILGAFFWFYYGFWLVRAAAYTALRRPLDACTSVFLFVLLYAMWNLIMTPFSSPSRLPIAVAIAIICVCASEMAVHRRTERKLVGQPA